MPAKLATKSVAKSPAKLAAAPSPLKPAQVRMARAGLDWSPEELAKAAGVNRNMIAGFERGIYEGEPATLAKLRTTLENAGIEFIDGATPGVRLKSGKKR